MHKPSLKLHYTHTAKKLTRIFGLRPVRQTYFWGALGVLLATTAYWSLLGASLHSTNADQLIDSYLFADKSSFAGASFPSTHSMLLKWPLFWAVGALGTKGWPVAAATVAVSVGAVAGLAWLLGRIERRRVVLATWYLALSSVLLLVPLQSYSGGILPVQMAMLTTRNIEYIVYIVGLALVLRAKGWLTLSFVGGAALLGVLAVSDRLFVGLGLGGALLMMVYGWLRRNQAIGHAALRLLAVNGLAAGVSVCVTVLLQTSGLFTEASNAQVSPYQFIRTPATAVLSMLYGGLGILTNAGANPAFDAVMAREIIGTALRRFWSVAGIGYVVNLAVAAFVSWRCWQLVAHVPNHPKKTAHSYPLAALLTLALLCSALVATTLFVVTEHYYAVDARYLTVWLFAGFLAAATTVRGVRLKRGQVGAIGIVILLSLPFSVWSAWQLYTTQNAAYSAVKERNREVVAVLTKEHISVLVGDYWRVLPIKAATRMSLTVAPLGSCTSYRDTLTSTAWQRGLTNRKVAYLLSTEKGLTDFPACLQAEVEAKFGRPSRVIPVTTNGEGSTERLLIYDQGFHHSDRAHALSASPAPGCQAKTIMQIVAHPDDDLLFFSPDLIHDIQTGACVRTVYLTSGDNGSDAQYWHGREAGIRAAYNHMLGGTYAWKNRFVRFAGGQELLISSPAEAPRISLVFINLPDGNPHGQGFSRSAHESLSKLLSGEILQIQTVGKHNSYTSAQLLAGLEELVAYYRPAEIRTFADTEPDHSDHVATGRFSQIAWEHGTQRGETTAALQRYAGYSVRNLNENISGDDLIAKEAVFLTYGAYDGATCRDSETCMHQTAYGTYLTRQYRTE